MSAKASDLMQAPRNIHAAMMVLGTMATISLVDNLVIEMSRSHGLWQFHVMRSCFAIPALIIMAMVMKQSLRPKRPVKLMLRCSAMAAGLMIYFSALGVLPVAQAGAGLFSAPIWVLVLSAVLFRYRITIWQVVAILGGFAGVVLLLQLDLGNLTVLSLLPLVAGLSYGLGALLTRYWCADESPMVLAIGVFAALGLMAAVPLYWMTAWPVTDAPGFLTWGWMPLTEFFLWIAIVQSVAAVIGMPLLAQAYRIGTPAYVAVFEYSFLVFAGLWALMLWGQGVGIQGWIGIAAITASGLVMSLLQKRDA